VVATHSRLTVLVAGVSLLASGLLVTGSGAGQAVAGASGDALPGAHTFAGSGLGSIPDGPAGCGSPASVLNVVFQVTGMPSRGLSDVRVTGLWIAHGYVGDLTVTLIAPNGSSGVLFGRTGATSSAGLGDASDLLGTYSFADDATGGWWAAAATAGETGVVAPGAYQASAVGGLGSTGARVPLASAFTAVTNPNATWTLRFIDRCAGYAGAVTAATLELRSSPAACPTQQSAVTSAQTQVTSAAATVVAATSGVTAADKVVKARKKALSKAAGKVKKARKALKRAQASGDGGAITKAAKALAGAKAKLKRARKGLTKAQKGASTAHTVLTSAQSTATSAGTQLAGAQAGLVSCQYS
jgi:hypothetical protein